MSFVGGTFAHDIFVSYAHGQDLSAPYSDPRRNPLYEWSRLFVDNLRSQLDLVLSDSVQSSDGRLDVWMDPKLNLPDRWRVTSRERSKARRCFSH